MKEHLLKLGFENKPPYQFHKESYVVVDYGTDSYGFHIWGIINRRFDERVFRGRIRNAEEFDLIFALVKEDYNLTEEEIEILRGGCKGNTTVS